MKGLPDSAIIGTYGHVKHYVHVDARVSKQRRSGVTDAIVAVIGLIWGIISL